MIKLAATVLAVMVLPTAVYAETIFVGIAHIQTQTGDCGFNTPYSFGFDSVFHPRIPGNQNYTALSLQNNIGALSYKVNNATFTGQAVDGTWVTRGAPVPVSGARITISTQVPATITDATNTVFLRFRMLNPVGLQCNVIFFGTYLAVGTPN